MNYSWKANECMLTKDHEKYDAEKCSPETEHHHDSPTISLAQTASETSSLEPESLVQKSLQELRRKFKKNPASGNGTYGEESDEFTAAASKAQKWARKYKSPDEIPDTLIPDEYDFRNLGGYDFTGPLRDQGQCGSCYTQGFIQTIEARLRLKYAHKREAIPQLSPQFMLMCNYLNEGCSGGWAIFHGFLAENGHLVKEECAPYTAKTKGDSCENYSQCPGYATVNESYYVGGYNFPPTEQLIQKEMLMHGPLVTEFHADKKFHHYKSGILT